jgi:nucleoside-diphosphate-sugar epimerase
VNCPPARLSAKQPLVRVLVTGARGRIGRHVVAQLLARGDEVVAVDRVPPGDDDVKPGVTVSTLDLADVDRTVFEGCAALVHLAAIPSPRHDPPGVVFGVNAGATFNALQAFTDAGGTRAVLASSLSALGMAWGPEVVSPIYAPVDEAHPLRPAEAYGLSKEVTERIGEMFHRRCLTTVVLLRFPGVFSPAHLATRLAAVHGDPGTEVDVRDLWTYIFPEDVAAAFVLAAHADLDGCEVVNVGAADTVSDLPTLELFRRYHPTTEIRSEIEGTASPWSTVKAQQVLGFTPRYSWRAQVKAPDEGAPT